MSEATCSRLSRKIQNEIPALQGKFWKKRKKMEKKVKKNLGYKIK
jgi:hypothetical protein